MTFFQDTTDHNEEDKRREKDDHQEIIHTRYRCRICAKFPVSLCNSCNLNFCELCHVQHKCTPQNEIAVHPPEEKGHQRFPKKAKSPDMKKLNSV